MLAPDPLAAVRAAVEACAAARPGSPLERLIQTAADACFRVPEGAEPAARGIVALLVPRFLSLAAETRMAMLDDPAAPGLAQAYCATLAALGDLATVFVAPDGELAGVYCAVCTEIRELMAASAQAQPVWDLVRQSRAIYAASRARPPPRAQLAAPLADDAEYYA